MAPLVLPLQQQQRLVHLGDLPAPFLPLLQALQPPLLSLQWLAVQRLPRSKNPLHHHCLPLLLLHQGGHPAHLLQGDPPDLPPLVELPVPL